MLTINENNEIIETPFINPNAVYKHGKAAKKALAYANTHDGISIKAIEDIINLVCDLTGGVIDPIMCVHLGACYGRAEEDPLYWHD